MRNNAQFNVIVKEYLIRLITNLITYNEQTMTLFSGLMTRVKKRVIVIVSSRLALCEFYPNPPIALFVNFDRETL